MKAYQYQQAVLAFLQSHVGRWRWQVEIAPAGRGHETYIAQGNGKSYFIKLGAYLAPYQALAGLGVTPPVITMGHLDNGVSILVQAFIQGRTPTWSDFQRNIGAIATIVRQVHHNCDLQRALPGRVSEQYQDVGLTDLALLQQRWQACRAHLPEVASYVDDTLHQLEAEIRDFTGAGLVASHNDMCNANWLIADDGQIYLLDLDMMSLDDPARDVGAVLWWYYPPELRQRFLDVVGYRYDEAFKHRMRVRMALHSLFILLPRPNSFDTFDPQGFMHRLPDFTAVVEGRENPRGYKD